MIHHQRISTLINLSLKLLGKNNVTSPGLENISKNNWKKFESERVKYVIQFHCKQQMDIDYSTEEKDGTSHNLAIPLTLRDQNNPPNYEIKQN